MIMCIKTSFAFGTSRHTWNASDPQYMASIHGRVHSQTNLRLVVVLALCALQEFPSPCASVLASASPLLDKSSPIARFDFKDCHLLLLWTLCAM